MPPRSGAVHWDLSAGLRARQTSATSLAARQKRYRCQVSARAGRRHPPAHLRMSWVRSERSRVSTFGNRGTSPARWPYNGNVADPTFPGTRPRPRCRPASSWATTSSRRSSTPSSTGSTRPSRPGSPSTFGAPTSGGRQPSTRPQQGRPRPRAGNRLARGGDPAHRDRLGVGGIRRHPRSPGSESCS